MKKPFLALFLNFVLPGAGLVYLGKWKWGLVNFAAVLAIGVLASLLLPDDVFDRWIRYIGYGLAGGSGGLAHQQAVAMNAEKVREP